MTDDRIRMLIMTVVDEEHTPQELRELEELAAQSPEVREEWARFARVKEATHTMTWQDPPPETWDRYWTSVYNRSERGIGWLLLIVGGLLVVGWQIWEAVPELLRELFEDETIPLPVRFGVVIAVLGAIVLVLSVVREQLVARRKDRYAKGVTR